jgi:hypothetical protein
MGSSTVAYRVAAAPAARTVSRLVNGSLGPAFRRLDGLQSRGSARMHLPCLAARGGTTDPRRSCLLRRVTLRERAALEIRHQLARGGPRGHRHEFLADAAVRVQRGLVCRRHPTELHHRLIPHPSWRHALPLAQP